VTPSKTISPRRPRIGRAKRIDDAMAAISRRSRLGRARLDLSGLKIVIDCANRRLRTRWHHHLVGVGAEVIPLP